MLIPSATTYVPNTLQINGVAADASTLGTTGVVIKSIAPNQTITVTFEVMVDAGVSDGVKLTNEATLSYNYTNALGTNIPATVTSNPATTIAAKDPITSVQKSATPQVVSSGSVVTYTITVTNDGSAAVTNAQLTDFMPAGMTACFFSLDLNGTVCPSNVLLFVWV